MELRDLKAGKMFKFAPGGTRIWLKVSDNDNLVYCYCRCLDDSIPAHIRAKMVNSANNDHRIMKDSEIIPVNQ